MLKSELGEGDVVTFKYDASADRVTWEKRAGAAAERPAAAPAGGDDPRARPGCISFYDPRTGANMITVGPEPDARAAHVVCPSAGTLLMWPSPVQHYVHPNLSEEHRVTISFNVQMNPQSSR